MNNNVLKKLYFILEQFEYYKKIAKHGKPRIEIKDFKKYTLKKYNISNLARNNILKKARETAHTNMANLLRDMSNNNKM
jgi:hypothetical protein